MPVVFSESNTIGDWLKGETEIPQHYSRDQIIFTNAGGAQATFTTGTVLGKITASGKFVPLAPAASDGSQNVAGILGPTIVVAATSDLNTYAITRDAVVSDINIAYPVGITLTQTNTAIAQMAVLGIIVRRTA